MSKQQELNEYLAAEIMGWEYLGRHSEQGEEPKAWYKTDNSKRTHWNPLTNLEQAFKVLREYDRYFHMINTASDAVHGSSAEMKSDNGFVIHESNNPCELIIVCILKAESKFEEFEEVFNNDQT